MPESTRRSFFRTALLPVFGALAGEALAAGGAEAQEAPPLTPRFVVGKPDIPPLDSPIVFARESTDNTHGTVEVLSLIQDEKGDNCFPWKS
jgi:hypothetical protein